MALDAPRAVPPYPRETISREYWYCLYCCHSNGFESQTVTHVRNSHLAPEIEHVKGEDYTNGDHLLILLDRWEKWGLLAVDRFALQVASLRGADDFELEVGDGLPEA